MNEVNNKYETLKTNFFNNLEKIDNTPLSSINKISKIIYNDMMNLGNEILQTWINDKTELENQSKKK
jgi:hypothetical protein